MSSYVILIFGSHRIPQAVETMECDTDDEAIDRSRKCANARQAGGYEIWLGGVKVASFFWRDVVGVDGKTDHIGS